MLRAAALPEAVEHGSQAIGIGLLDRHDFDRRSADLGLEGARGALGDDVATVDDPDAIGERIGLLEVLRGQEDGHTFAPRQPLDLLPEGRPALHVETGRRLVEEEDTRAVDERHREVESPLHPARVAADAPVGGLGQPDPSEKLVGAGPPLGARESLERRLEPKVLATGQERVERGLLEGGADDRAHLRPLLGDVVPGHARGSLGRREERRQHVHRGRLPRAVGPEEAVDLTGLDHEVDSVDRPRPLPVLHDEPLGLDRGLSAHSAEPSVGPKWQRRFPFGLDVVRE